MSERLRELARRQEELQLRSAVQRRSIAAEVRSIEARFDSVDRVASVARNILTNPLVITGGIVALLTIGRVGGFRLVGRAMILMTAARRLVKTLKKF